MRKRNHKDEELREVIKTSECKGICQFNYEDFKCENPATSIIRMHFVCPKHFKVLKLDNVKRDRKSLEIPANFEFVKKISEAHKRWTL